MHNKPVLVNHWTWKGKEYRFDMYLSNDFSNLKNVQQVYVLVLNSAHDSVLVVRSKSGMWMLPGGGVEENETLLDTLQREVKEETNCEVKIYTAKPLFYQEAYKKSDSGEWEFSRIEVRFSVEIDKDLDFISDPDNGDVVEARWIMIEDLDKYLDWGETAKLIKNLLTKK